MHSRAQKALTDPDVVRNARAEMAPNVIQSQGVASVPQASWVDCVLFLVLKVDMA